MSENRDAVGSAAAADDPSAIEGGQSPEEEPTTGPTLIPNSGNESSVAGSTVSVDYYCVLTGLQMKAEALTKLAILNQEIASKAHEESINAYQILFEVSQAQIRLMERKSVPPLAVVLDQARRRFGGKGIDDETPATPTPCDCWDTILAELKQEAVRLREVAYRKLEEAQKSSEDATNAYTALSECFAKIPLKHSEK